MKRIWLLLVLFGAQVHAEGAWELIKEKNDISLYSLQKPNHKLKHYKAQTRINKDADTILNALQDTKACQQWVHNCVSNKMVDMISVSKRVYHTVIHSPLWYKDRDFYLQSHVIYNPEEQLFTIKLTSDPEYSKSTKDRILITQVDMMWRLKYVSEHMTQVTYQVYIDPKLPMKTINNMMIKKSVFQTMLGLTRLVDNPTYARTKYSKSELDMLTEED